MAGRARLEGSMKQNERLLVYAVTAFLALILVVAVVFGDDGERTRSEGAEGGTSLNDILNGGDTDAAKDGDQEGAGDERGEGEAQPVESVAAIVEQPLRAQAPSPSDLVAQRIGASRREHMVRWVTARGGDAWGTLVQRWCGKVSPYLDEAQRLNETTVGLREGQQVAVPWVEDEVLLALWEADQRPTLISGGASGGGAAVEAATTAAGSPAPANALRTPALLPAGVVQGSTLPDGQMPAATVAGVPAVEVYKVKQDDMLWPLLAKRFGNGKVPGMLKKVAQLNPGINVDRLQAGQSIKIPLAGE
jgi:hypothetical protein